jgi:hypothetical protein
MIHEELIQKFIKKLMALELNKPLQHEVQYLTQVQIM